MTVEGPGEEQPAIDSLLGVLDARAAAGDVVCRLAAEALRREQPGFAPDAMAAAVDRLLHLVREQEAQIRALQSMVETQL